MSDVSVLAEQYETAAQLSQTINNAVITLKKVYQHLPGSETVSLEQVEESRHRLAEITATLARVLEPTTNLEPVGKVPITGALISRLRTAQQGNLPYFADDLRRVSVCFRDKSSALSPADLALLDRLAAVADAEASHVFRRLMRT
jgi:hypothetical protein